MIGGLPITREIPSIAPRPLGVIDEVMILIATPPIIKEAYLSSIVALWGR